LARNVLRQCMEANKLVERDTDYFVSRCPALADLY
jgi:hypothetical protein